MADARVLRTVCPRIEVVVQISVITTAAKPTVLTEFVARL